MGSYGQNENGQKKGGEGKKEAMAATTVEKRGERRRELWVERQWKKEKREGKGREGSYGQINNGEKYLRKQGKTIFND